MKEAFEIVQAARGIDRLTTKELAENLFENFFELHGDRRFGDDPAILGGVASLEGRAVTIIGTQKGHDVKENVYRNFGSPHPEGYRKSIRLMKQAEKFGRPVITFINTSGAFCDVESENRGIGEAIAESLLVMSQLKVPILSIFIGEGGSGGALALGMGNQVWMMENSMYSVLSPEGFASILWKDSSRSKEAAEVMKISPQNLLELDIIDKIIPESKRRKKMKNEDILYMMRKEIILILDMMDKWDAEQIVQQRQKRFREF